MNTYPSYKDSGVEWIGEIPSGWDIKPMYTRYSQNKTKNDNSTSTVSSLSYGRLVKRNVETNLGLLPDNFDSYQLLDTGYIILRMTDLQNDHKSLRVGMCEFQGIITSAYIGLKPLTNVCSKYFFYYLYMCDLKKVFYGLGGGLRQSVSYNDFKRFPLSIPPPQEQQQISDYLDYKISKIDTLIEKTQQKIELLKEQRTSLINTTVTKGLNPNVEMKDSGVEWIGEIPSGWNIKKLKYIGNLYGGLTGKSGKDFNDEDNPHNKPFIPFTNIFNNVYISDKHYQYVNVEPDERQNRVRENDLFFLMSSEGYDDLGKSSILISEIDELYLNSFCKGFRINSGKVDPLFINYQLLGDTQRKLISIEGKGFTRINLRQDKLNSTYMFIPPLQEQQQIVGYLDKETIKIDKLIDIESKRINLLKEYRQSLISDVVTGKVDIRDEVLA